MAYPGYAASQPLYHSNSVSSRRYSHSPNPPVYNAGYGAPAGFQAGPPPGADPQLWQWFNAVDADRSGSISVNELQAALVNGPSRCLPDACPLLMFFSCYSGNWSSEWSASCNRIL
jgi:hypothetical protein